MANRISEKEILANCGRTRDNLSVGGGGGDGFRTKISGSAFICP
jgi:hypothetical protein